jgi:hypothetical protein
MGARCPFTSSSYVLLAGDTSAHEDKAACTHTRRRRRHLSHPMLQPARVSRCGKVRGKGAARCVCVCVVVCEKVGVGEGEVRG